MSSPSESLSRTQTRTHHNPTGTGTGTGDRHAHMHTATAPLPFFHPTRAKGTATGTHQDANNASGADVRWRSRASRKRLYTSEPVSVQHEHRAAKRRRAASEEEGMGKTEKSATEPWLADLRVRHKAESKLRPRVEADVSFWVAVIFVLGSIAWVSSPTFPVFHV